MSTIKRGGADAAKALTANGGSLQWFPLMNYNNIGPDMVQLDHTALSSHCAAIISLDVVPAAQTPVLKEITSSGVPLILVNTGNDAVKQVGALIYIGSDNSAAGALAGEYYAQHGVKHVLCVNTLPGTIIQQQRCDGIKKGEKLGGGSGTELDLPPTNYGNSTSVAQAIKAALLQDRSIDGVQTLDLSDADIAASALSQAQLTAKVKLGTFDLNTNQLQRIQAGTQMLAIDQEPYAQGYLAVSLAYQYAKFGLKLPETDLLTGPTLVTKANVAAAVTGAKYGAR
jgi:simple sugar transport system substrate-binding protein